MKSYGAMMIHYSRRHIISLGANRQFEAAGLTREHWSNATPIRTIFREAFANAGLPYFNPHSFRNTLVQLGQDLCKTPEQFKAWSQNLGHEKVLTTFLSYGEVACQRQGEIIRDLAMHHNRPCNRMPTKSPRQCSKDCVSRVLTCGLK